MSLGKPTVGSRLSFFQVRFVQTSSVLMSTEQTDRCAPIQLKFCWRERRKKCRSVRIKNCLDSPKTSKLKHQKPFFFLSAPHPQCVTAILGPLRLTLWLWRCGEVAELVTRWSQATCPVWWWPTPPRRCCPRSPAHSTQTTPSCPVGKLQGVGQNVVGEN